MKIPPEARQMRFSLWVLFLITLILVFLEFVVLIAVFLFQNWALSWFPLVGGAVLMVVAGIVAETATLLSRKSDSLFPLSGLIGVTCLMAVPLVAIVLLHLAMEKATAQLVFKHVLVYYLAFLPFGTWLLLPPKPGRIHAGNSCTDSK